mmetsp:Transcript_75732/g.126275  ORF Transcript_75732/g.126275 Transcript_75732/m.126275 type:complete len:213 (-) Transcript_75732:677-1315(-)
MLADQTEICQRSGWRRWRQRELKRLRRWRQITRAARSGAHITRGQLVPCVREGVVELRLVRSKDLNKLLVFTRRVVKQRHIAREHHGGDSAPLVRCRGFGEYAADTRLGAPLRVTPGACVCLPLEGSQVFEVLVAPLGRCGAPRPFETACECIFALTGAALARPRVRRVFVGRSTCTLRARAMRLAECVATADERDGLRVIHAHASKCIPDI